MQNRVGDEFEGSVSSVTSFGLFVELTDIYIEGLVHVTELSNDYYRFDPVHHCLQGERSGVVYRMGDSVRVKVVRVDLDDKKIDLAMLGKTASAPVAKGQAKADNKRGKQANSGKKNTGKKNTGKKNTGKKNTGKKNTGKKNTGKKKTARGRAGTKVGKKANKKVSNKSAKKAGKKPGRKPAARKAEARPAKSKRSRKR
jgi:ribonuclease R